MVLKSGAAGVSVLAGACDSVAGVALSVGAGAASVCMGAGVDSVVAIFEGCICCDSDMSPCIVARL